MRPPVGKRTLLVAVALVLGAAVVPVVLTRTPSRMQRISAAKERASPAAATLEKSLRALAAGDSAGSRDRWDPDYVADQLGRNPAVIIRWVRANTYWIPYHGVLRGSAGVLLDRQGNSLDRALLLASMLARAGDTVRLAHGELTREQALARLPELIARRRRAAQALSTDAEPDMRTDISRVAVRYHLDERAIAPLMNARLDSVTRMLSQLDMRTSDQTRRLVALLAGSAPERMQPHRLEDQLEALRDHWWVQRLAQGAWTDADLLDPSTTESGDTARTTTSPAALDSALFHRVILRLVTERWAEGRLSQHTILEREFRPAQLIGKSITLVIQPTGWSGGLIANRRDPVAALRQLALEQQSWQATLGIGREAAGEAVITRSGAVRGADNGGFLSGLGHGVTSAIGGGNGDGELTGMWLEYEVDTPGQEPRRIQRQLFDLIGPAARAAQPPVTLSLNDDQRLERSLALMRSTEVLLQASAVAPDFVVHLAAAAALANGELLRFAGRRELAGDPSSEDRLQSLTAPLPSRLYTLAAVRLPGDPEPDVFVDRPNILSRHAFLIPQASQVVRRVATDIVANEVGVALDAPRPVEARLRQGVRDTNAEALLHMGERVLGSVAEAFATSNDWSAVTSMSSGSLERLGPDARSRMSDDLAAGYVLVTPVHPDAAASAGQTGWWRIDPRTGHTLGVFSNGWGQEAAERSRLQKAVIIVGTMAEAWAFEFLYCHGAFTFSPGQEVARATPLLDAIVPPLAAEQHDVCVWDAWKAAITAGLWERASVVWPLLLKRLRLQALLNQPLFHSGELGPGDAPPLLGKSSAPPPPPPCPPGGGAPAGAAGAASGEGGVNPLGQTQPAPGGENPNPTAPGGTPSANAESGDEVNALAKTQPATATGEAPGAAPVRPQPSEAAGESPAVNPSRAQPAGEAVKQPEELDVLWGDTKPMDPGELNENLVRGTAWRQKSQRAFDQAQRQLADAQRKVNAINQSPPPAEGDLAGQQRVNDANMDLKEANLGLDEARQDLARAQKLEDYYNRLQAANDALIKAREAKRAATEQFLGEIQNGADFHGSEWERWKKASNEYEEALQAYRDGLDQQWSKPGPVTKGATQQLPNRPLPPGSTQPLENNPVGGGCQSGGGGVAAGEGSTSGRGLGDIEGDWHAADDEFGRLSNELDQANDAFFKAQKAAKQAGLPPPDDEAERALFFKKMDAWDRRLRLGNEFKEAGGRLDPYGRPVTPTSSSAPQVQVMVGLGGLNGR